MLVDVSHVVEHGMITGCKPVAARCRIAEESGITAPGAAAREPDGVATGV